MREQTRMQAIVGAIILIGVLSEGCAQRNSTNPTTGTRSTSVEVSLRSRTVHISRPMVSCDTLVVTSIGTKKPWSTETALGSEQSLVAEISHRSDKVAMNVVGNLLRINTVENIGIGRAEAASYSIVKQTAEYLVAATSAYEPSPTAIIPAYESIVLNKKNGLAIWTITGHEMIPGAPPDTYAIYLQCR